MSLQLKNMKVQELKKELAKMGLKKSGVKSELIKRLRCARREKEIDVDEQIKSDNCKKETASSEVFENNDVNTFKNLNEIRQKLNAEESTPCSNEEMEDKQRVTEISHFKATSQIHPKNAEKNSYNAINSELSNENKETRSENAEANDNKGAKNRGSKEGPKQCDISVRKLLVSGLTKESKILDVKKLFSKYGKVNQIKIMRSVKGPQIKWIGELLMATSKDASQCIENLHNTKFGGQVISVERRPTASIVKKSKVTTVKKKIKKNEAQESACGKTDQEAKHKSNCNKTIISDDNGHSIPEGGHRGNDIPIRNRGRESFRRPFETRDRSVSFACHGRFSDIRRPFPRPSPFDQPDYRLSSRVTHRFRSMGSQSDRDMLERERAWRLEKEKNRMRLECELLINENELLKVRREQLELDLKKLHHQRQMSISRNKTFRGQREGQSHDFSGRRNNYENLFHKEKFSGEDLFPQRCENSTYYKKATFMHEECHTEQMKTASPHSRYDEHMQGLSHEFSGRNHNFFHKEKFSVDDRFPYRRNDSIYKRNEFMHEKYRREKIETPPLHSRFDECKVKYHSGHLKSEFRKPRPSSSSIKYSSRRSGYKLGYAPRSRELYDY